MRRSGARLTVAILASGLLVGTVSGLLVRGSVGPGGLWRVLLLPVSLACVVAGLSSLVGIGLQEWRRVRVPVGHYVTSVGLLLGGFVIAALATS